MIQVHSTIRFEDVGGALAAAAHHHGASILSVTDLGRRPDARVFTVSQTEMDSALVQADPRFAALLPCRIAAVRDSDGVTFECLSPAEHCVAIHRPDLAPVAEPLDGMLRDLIREAAASARRAMAAAATHGGAGTGATEWQMSMRGAIGQRIDRQGTRIEDLAGTGHLDAPGG